MGVKPRSVAWRLHPSPNRVNRHPCAYAPVVLAYLDELDRIGGYGKGRAGVIRRFVENGIAEAIQSGVLDKKNANDFTEEQEGDDEE